jgi:hypothetical protein
MEAAREKETAQPGRRRDLGLILALLALAGGLRAWQVSQITIPSPDSIAFIQQAWQLEHHPWRQVLRGADRHPGYPVAVLAASRLVRPLADGPESAVMQRGAQLASALSSVLLVIPMFFLGRELFGRRVAFGACALFQCLPSSSLAFADGLSEATYLLFAAAALWMAAWGLRGRSAWPLALCGAFAGLAYLTRPEGALLAGTEGLVLLGCQAVPAWRRSWGGVLAAGLSLTLAFAAVGGPYVAVVGQLTVKPTARRIVDGPVSEADAPSVSGGSRPLFATIASAEGGSKLAPALWGGWEVGRELAQGFFYFSFVPLVLGLWWCRDRLAQGPGAWVLLLVCLALLVLLWRVATVFGYASDRHLLLVTLCGTYWVVAGVGELTRRLSAWGRGPLRFRSEPRLAAAGLLGLLIVVGLPKSLTFAHPERAAFRTAGAWLAEHAAPADVITDPYRWAWYYSGRAFQEKRGAAPCSDGDRTRYVVLPRTAQESARRPQVAQALKLAAQGEEVYRAVESGRKGQSMEVVVYALPMAR